MTNRITDEMVEAAAWALCDQWGEGADPAASAEDFMDDARAALSAALPLMDGWIPIDVLPSGPMDVDFYLGRLAFKNMDGTPAPVPPGCRRHLGYWDGEDWFEHYTNHQVFEFEYDENAIHKPTHWRPSAPLPPAPKGDE